MFGVICSIEISSSAGSMLVRRSSPKRFLTSSASLLTICAIAPRAAQDVLQLGDRLDQLGVFVFDLLALEADQRPQTHVDDRLRLHLAELEALREPLLGLVGRLAAADDLDDFVDVVERDAVAFEQVRALFGLAQVVARAARDDVFAVRDEVLEQLLEREHLRLDRAPNRRRAASPTGTSASMLKPNVACSGVCLKSWLSTTFGVALLLQLDDDAHALAVRLVVHARDAGDALLGVGFGDRLDDAALVDLVRNLGDDDLVLARAPRRSRPCRES